MIFRVSLQSDFFSFLSAQNGHISVRLHLRELWTFGKHPRTSTVVYDFSSGSSRIANMSMMICGQKLVISLESASGRMKHLLLNWRTLQARVCLCISGEVP
jgi:hypothetical protein